MKSIVVAVVFLVLGISLPAGAVMPPKYYEKAVQESQIKAVARITAVTIVSTTRQATRKQVDFTLIHGFGTDTPKTFRGYCYSVDQTSQDPGVGGRIYYHPLEGMEVLVTISSDRGAITSLTPYTRELKQRVELSGLSLIEFTMGRARAKLDDCNWFLFRLDGQPAGYLRICEGKSQDPMLMKVFSQDFMVQIPKGRQMLFQIRARTRADELLTPEWLSLKRVDIMPDQSLAIPVREYGFRPEQKTVIKDGILTPNGTSPFDIGLPSQTTTDFLVFSLVEQLKRDKGSPMKLNILETLEMNLKTNVWLEYKGRDREKGNLHVFVQSGKSQARYWINDDHQLVEVQWDSDKQFIRAPGSEVLNLLGS